VQNQNNSILPKGFQPSKVRIDNRGISISL
jgi:hypothetical protein